MARRRSATGSRPSRPPNRSRSRAPRIASSTTRLRSVWNASVQRDQSIGRSRSVGRSPTGVDGSRRAIGAWRARVAMSPFRNRMALRNCRQRAERSDGLRGIDLCRTDMAEPGPQARDRQGGLGGQQLVTPRVEPSLGQRDIVRDRVPVRHHVAGHGLRRCHLRRPADCGGDPVHEAIEGPLPGLGGPRTGALAGPHDPGGEALPFDDFGRDLRKPLPGQPLARWNADR